jgi:hypothetical protein
MGQWLERDAEAWRTGQLLDLRAKLDAQQKIRTLCDLMWPHLQSWALEFAGGGAAAASIGQTQRKTHPARTISLG